MATLTRKKSKILLTTWLLSIFLGSASVIAALASGETAATSENDATSYRVSSVAWEQSDDNYILRIKGETAPTYTMYELFDPLRVTIDIADASLDQTVALPLESPQGPVSLVSGKVLTDKEPYITRIELLLTEDQSYTVERVDNDIIVKFPKSAEEQGANPAYASAPGLSGGPAVQETGLMVEEVSEPAQFIPGKNRATMVSAIDIKHDSTETEVFLKADGPIKDYKKVHLGKNPEAKRPDRMYIDLKNVRLNGPFETKNVGTALAQIRTAKRQDGFRIVFDSGLDQLFDYVITERPDGLLVTIKEPSAATAVIANLISDDAVEPELAVAPEPETVEAKAEVAAQTPPSAMLVPDIEPAKPVITPAPEMPAAKNKGAKSTKPAAATPVNDLAFTGYNKQRITVDFYKIDLHNVFRLFGEISNLNIVVDEGVNGSLTLALNDVPWDFALDIILNLKDLQKEERFNTIVISPKSKMFTWPERTLDQVEFKADLKIQQEEAQETGGIKISKRLEVPETVIEAKKLIHQAQVNERNGNYEAALPLYEEAIAKWDSNINLAKKIASICLVNLEQNAKAIYYAKAALKINPNDQEADLQAAIALARMKRDNEAKEYFELAVSGAKPPAEALISYASYCEEKQNYDCAINMLKKHEDLYGDSLATMVSKARVLDKQGNQDLAANEYRAILLSGYEIPPDLARYIKGRASLGGN